jgi:hypothetical protein
MNGRIADGLTGRFLSADPYVTNPGGTQFFNRYSYVNNNPMTLTNPSGFCVDACVSIVGSAILTVGSWAKKLFGSKNGPPPPRGCRVAANSCYGKAGSSKLFDMVKDILNMPGARMASEYEDLILYYQQPQTDLGVGVEELAECRRLGGCDLQQRGSPDADGAYGFEVFVKVFSANSGNYGVHKVVSAVRSIFGRSVRRPTSDNPAGGTAQATEAFHYTFAKYLRSIQTNGLRQGTYATRGGTLPSQACDATGCRWALAIDQAVGLH